ncbi:MAG TPA: peroxide stress protein YaaA [Microthrixaceae bacterium]|nr:peroxide stress protein YaaA [Microthrixaceae bacterium]
MAGTTVISATADSATAKKARSKKLPLILLPPSEGKAQGGSDPAWESGTMRFGLDDQRGQVAGALAKAMRKAEADRSKLLGVKGVALAAATQANLELGTARTMPALTRYSGVLYDVLDAATLSPQAKRRLDRSVVIFSGLYGLVAPSDRIPDYKLKMGASLPGVGRLSTFWRPELSRALGAQVQGRQIWNLLPNEHDAAWDGPAGTVQVSVRFLERRIDGSMVAVSHWNKFFKGALVRLLLEEPGTTPDDLADWRHPAGWILDPALEEVDGDRRRLAFVREAVS